ncbi:MAG: nucleotide exchange factor GrpE [Candidatus Coatesbacteria bacterium]|nr:nucleotide exchange factor GrpE [Candidatus Coatesbacteria bacterium]
MDIKKEIESLQPIQMAENVEEPHIAESLLQQINDIYAAFADKLSIDSKSNEELKKAMNLLEEQVEDKREQIRALKSDIKRIIKDEQNMQNELLDIFDLIEQLQTFAKTSFNNPLADQISSLYRHTEIRMKELNIKPIKPYGQILNPNFHEAIAAVENPGKKPFEIVEVVKNGYIKGDRVLRKAVVITVKEQ